MNQSMNQSINQSINQSSFTPSRYLIHYTYPLYLIHDKLVAYHYLGVSLGVNFISDVRDKKELLGQGWKLPVGLELTNVTCKKLCRNEHKTKL